MIAKEWKFLLVDEYRTLMQSGRASLHLKISSSDFVHSMLKVFKGLSKEDTLHPLRFAYKPTKDGKKVLTNFEAFNIFFKKLCDPKYGLMESFAGNVLPMPECKDVAVFNTIGKILAKCVLDKVKIPSRYFNSSFYKFLVDELPDIRDLNSYHPAYTQHLRQVFLRRDQAKLEEFARATSVSDQLWRTNPSVLFDSVLLKMLQGSRMAQLKALKTAFFSSVELKGHLSIFTWNELQELLEET